MSLDLGSDLPIAGLAIQSRVGGGQWVSSFAAEYWKDGETAVESEKIDGGVVFSEYDNLFF